MKTEHKVANETFGAGSITPQDVQRAHEALWILGERAAKFTAFLADHPEVVTADDLDSHQDALAELGIPFEQAQTTLAAKIADQEKREWHSALLARYEG